MDAISRASVFLLLTLTLRGITASRFPHNEFGPSLSGRLLQASNCIYPTDGTDCLFCESLYYPDPAGSPDCLPVSDPNCAVSGGFADNCDTCAATYYFNGKIQRCIPQSLPGCLAYADGKNYCTSCDAGLILTAGTCAADNSPNCAVYTLKTNRCTTCSAGYFFFNGGCRPRNDPNCSYAQVFGPLCSSCNAGYFPNSGSRLCEQQNDPNCSAYAAGTSDCTTCANLYYLKSAKCVPISAFYVCTLSVANTNSCTTCIGGYSTDGNGGCVKN